MSFLTTHRLLFNFYPFGYSDQFLFGFKGAIQRILVGLILPYEIIQSRHIRIAADAIFFFVLVGDPGYLLS